MKIKTINKTFIILTSFVLLVPSIDKLTRVSDRFPLTERKAKKHKPILAERGLIEYINAFDEYYNDAFGGRNIFIHAYSHIKYFVLRISPFPNMGVIGKDNYFFLGNNSGKVVNNHIGLRLLTQNAISRITNNVYKNYKWCESKNIKYYLFIAPDKHTIYSDKLPEYYNKKFINRNLDNLSKSLLNNNIPFIDIRAKLHSLKDKFSLYAKADSHWNDNGAYFSYQTLISIIGQDFPQTDKFIARNDFDIIKSESRYKTTTDMLNLSRYIHDIDVTYQLTNRIKLKATKIKNQLSIPLNYRGLKNNYESRYYSTIENGLKILVFLL